MQAEQKYVKVYKRFTHGMVLESCVETGEPAVDAAQAPKERAWKERRKAKRKKRKKAYCDPDTSSRPPFWSAAAWSDEEEYHLHLLCKLGYKEQPYTDDSE